MRRLYQTSWHGIPFSSFAKLSSTELAGPDFFDAFYAAFFKRYSHWDELDPAWVRLKVDTIGRVHERIFRSMDSRILSIGCGLGLQEKFLLDLGYSDLTVTEVSAHPLRWIRQQIPDEKLHVGLFPACLPSDALYDAILMASIDYFFDAAQWSAFLQEVRSRLVPGGRCTMLSWSFEREQPLLRFMAKVKDRISGALESVQLRHRGQFWGYQRTSREHLEAFAKAGFIQCADEFLDVGVGTTTYVLTAVRGDQRSPRGSHD